MLALYRIRLWNRRLSKGRLGRLWLTSEALWWYMAILPSGYSFNSFLPFLISELETSFTLRVGWSGRRNSLLLVLEPILRRNLGAASKDSINYVHILVVTSSACSIWYLWIQLVLYSKDATLHCTFLYRFVVEKQIWSLPHYLAVVKWLVMMICSSHDWINSPIDFFRMFVHVTLEPEPDGCSRPWILISSHIIQLQIAFLSSDELI
jgi:hypothetical protein